MLRASDEKFPGLRRYLSCIRFPEVLVLQGSPLAGAAFTMGSVTPATLSKLAVLAAASLLLVAHVFLFNDWAGARADLNDPSRAAGVFAAKGISRRAIGILYLVLLALSLLLFSALGGRVLAVASAIALLSLLYSLPSPQAKGVPLLSSALHLAGGGLHFLLGYSLFSPIDRRGLLIALFFGLVFAAGHLNQEVRDYDGDHRNGIKTNAVTFGKKSAFVAGLVLFSLAYLHLVALALVGVVPGVLALAAVLFPVHLQRSLETLTAGLSLTSIQRLQACYRGLYVLIGLAMLGALMLAR